MDNDASKAELTAEDLALLQDIRVNAGYDAADLVERAMRDSLDKKH